MSPRQVLIDNRLKLSGSCIYCGSSADTSEHVPSKILIDEPHPIEYPTVAACNACNAGYSLDEEYLACLLECILCDSTDPLKIKRLKIKKSIEKNSNLRKKIEITKKKDKQGNIYWLPDIERIKNVIIKLARGHVAYELYPIFEKPNHAAFTTITSLTREQRQNFESSNIDDFNLLPEINSRSFLRELGVRVDGFKNHNGWIIVQPDRYRYSVIDTGGVLVRIVLSEYLFCEIQWW